MSATLVAKDLAAGHGDRVLFSGLDLVVAPGVTTFLLVLVAMGFANLAFQAIANSSVQLWVDPEVRGRVMGLYLLVFVGGTPLGAPLVGWITTAAGPRVGLAFCGLVPLLAAGTLALVLARRVRRDGAGAALAPAARADGGRGPSHLGR